MNLWILSIDALSAKQVKITSILRRHLVTFYLMRLRLDEKLRENKRLKQMTNHLIDLCGSKAAWPSILSALFIAIMLASVAFSQMVPDSRAWIFSIILVVGIFWTILIYVFCYIGFHAIGWFFLILPLATYLTWKLSYLIASMTTNESCIIGS